MSGRQYLQTQSQPISNRAHPSADNCVGRPVATLIDSESTSLDEYLQLSVNLFGILAEHVLVHPCIVLRRQCQVNSRARRRHLTPLSLPLIVYNLQRRQGPGVLFKGLGSSLIATSARLGAERALTCVEKSTGTDVTGRLWQIFGGALLTWPFLSASVSDTVQSCIAQDQSSSSSSSLLSFLADAAQRLCIWRISPCGRQLPCWQLAPAAAVMLALHALISSAADRLIFRLMQLYSQLTAGSDDVHGRPENRCVSAYGSGDEQDESGVSVCTRALTSAALARYATEALLYPAETVMCRLQVQGTWTVTDHLDSGRDICAVTSNYDGLIDCWQRVRCEEGVTALYAGFGALLWQAGIHLASLHCCRYVLLAVRKWVLEGGSVGVWRKRDSGGSGRNEVSRPAHRRKPSLLSSLSKRASQSSGEIQDGRPAQANLDQYDLVGDDEEDDDDDEGYKPMSVEEWRRRYGRQ